MGTYDLNKVPKVDTTVTIPKDEYKERVQKLRQRLFDYGADIGIAYGTPHMPGDVFYLLGYDPHLENAMLLISQEKMFILCGPEGERYGDEMLKYGEIRIVDEMQIPLEDYPVTKTVSIDEVIAELFHGRIKRAAILTKDDVMTTECMAMMEKHLGNEVEFIDASDVLYYEMRLIKSLNEQKVLRVSNRIAQEAVKAIVESIIPGMTELELAAIGDYVMKKMGASAYGFDSMTLSGNRINTIIGRGTNKIIKSGELVSIRASCRYEGYASVTGRMVIAGGEGTKEQIKFLEHGLKAHELSVEKFFYGGQEKDVDLAARNYFKQHNMAKYQIYSVAHGTGITECLEARPFTQHSKGTIPKNISMMIDIGIYGHPEFYGFCFEDPYLINDRGETERLVDYPMRTF